MSIVQKIKEKYRGYEYYLDRQLCHTLLGHGAGIKQVIRGHLDKNQATKLTKPMGDKATELSVHGFTTLGKYYDDDLIQRIRDEYEACLKDEDKYLKPNDWRYGILFPQKNMPSTRELITREIINIIEEHYQTYVRVSTIQCWRNVGPPEGVDTSRMFSNSWHFDYASTSIIKLFVCLSDVGEDDGPFHIYPIRQTKELVRMGYKTRENYAGAADYIEQHDNLIRLTGLGGTAALCNTEINLHKAGVPKYGHHRDMIQFQFVPSDRPVPENWYEELNLKGVEKLKK